jgi:hypothetical protein
VIRELVIRELVIRELVIRELVIRELVIRELVIRDPATAAATNLTTSYPLTYLLTTAAAAATLTTSYPLTYLPTTAAVDCGEGDKVSPGDVLNNGCNSFTDIQLEACLPIMLIQF